MLIITNINENLCLLKKIFVEQIFSYKKALCAVKT
jgi:hypothetical protein